MTNGLDLITEIHTDVRYIKQTLGEHVGRDEKVQSEYIRPLWEAHQQRKGAARLANLLYGILGGAIVAVADIALAVAGKK